MQPKAVLEFLAFDGAGAFHATWVDDFNGTADDGTIDGTYAVAPDCTFRFVSNADNGQVYHSAGVIAGNAGEFRFVDTDAGAVSSGTGYRLEAGNCSDASLSGTYGSLSTGYALLDADGTPLSAPVPVEVVANFTYDGAGGVTVASQASYGAGGASFTGTGTYSVTSSCAGTATLNISDGEIDHTAFVVLNGGRSAYFIGKDLDDVFTGSSTRR